MNDTKKRKVAAQNRPPVVVAMVVVAFVVDFLGKYATGSLALPLWLDCLGTLIIAYYYGPVSGAAVGFCTSMAYGIFNLIAFLYSGSSMLVGLIFGIMVRRGYFGTLYGICIITAVLSLVAAATAVPLNIYFFNGYAGHLWYDGIFDMMRELGCSIWTAGVIAELVIDVPDKFLALMVLYGIVRLPALRRLHRTRKKMENIVLLLLLGLGFSCVSAPTAEAIDSQKLAQGYYTVSRYDERRGLPGGSAEQIAFAGDGHMYVGAYSGLYQYDGNSFRRIEAERLKSVSSLYCDKEGRLFVGNQNKELFIFVDGKSTVTTDGGFIECSGNITTITGYAGKFMLGTKNSLDILSIYGGLELNGHIEGVRDTVDLAVQENGLVAAVTGEGVVRIIKDNRPIYTIRPPAGVEEFTRVLFLSGELWVGGRGSTLCRYRLGATGAELVGTILMGDLGGIRRIRADERGLVFVCADNGAGYVDRRFVFRPIGSGTVAGAVDDVGFDYQGNIWLASATSGLYRISESIFRNVHPFGTIGTAKTNCVVKWQDMIVIGTDHGLETLDTKYAPIGSSLAGALAGEKIKRLSVDSQGRLWVMTDSREGLFSVSPSGDIVSYRGQGLHSLRYTAQCELMDGRMAAAGDRGIDFLRDGRVVASLGEAEGLTVPQILSIWQRADGTIFAGSSGGGLYIIREDKVVSQLTTENGLDSNFVHGIIPGPAEETVILLTSGGVNYYMGMKNIVYIHRLVDLLCVDMIRDGRGNYWAATGNGVYLIYGNELFARNRNHSVQLDYRDGFVGSVTDGSRVCLADDGWLYIPSDKGCFTINAGEFRPHQQNYRLRIETKQADGTVLPIYDGQNFSVSGSRRDLDIQPRLINFADSIVYVGYQLEGWDEKEIIVPASELSNIRYSNLPGGTYRLIMRLYGSDKSTIQEMVVYNLTKDDRIFDGAGFRVYVFTILGMILAGVLYMIIHRITADSRHRQEQLERQNRMASQTIFTIAHTVDAKDSRTSRHSNRVAEYSRSIAKAMGWSMEEQDLIYKAGLLHDIGKIGIPDAILNKPEKLTNAEYAIMKSHAQKGASILRNFTMVKDIHLGAKYHHERYDGTGYPEGLKGEGIPIYARIIGVADAFDAMMDNRIYRRGLKLEDVIAEMHRCAGTQFDPEIVDIFLALIENGQIDVEVLEK